MASKPIEQTELPAVPVPAAPGVTTPVKRIDPATLRNLGGRYSQLFKRYAAERLPAEKRWMENLRQYLGIYDPDIERELPRNRSRAYPRITRVKCVSLLSRIMNLMFPGNEVNWELTASPSPEMDPNDVAEAVRQLMTALQSQGMQVSLTQDLIDEAVRTLADKHAADLTNLINDQLQELGGNQSLDWIALNRKVLQSGIRYGLGVLEGPYVRKIQQSGWALAGEDAAGGGGFKPITRTIYKPMFEHMSVWDFYPDMSSKTLPGEGYFKRKIMGRHKLRKLADRPDFFGAQIREVIRQMPGGNFKMLSWETELRTMGTAVQAQYATNAPSSREKFEIIVWKGPVSANTLREAGAEVPDKYAADDIDAELWMINDWVIKAEINPWVLLDVDVPSVHTFVFDEDDTSPISQGLPSIMRDSQLAVCASTRMTLDNASVTCGPNLELNTALLRADQDLTGVQPYKMWYRDDDQMTAQFPAVRPIAIDGHIAELQGLIKLFMDFAETETFIGPSTGGDMTKVPSEASRTVAGGSMLRSDAALPFKDIVRNYDTFTQSVIGSMVDFNRRFNPDQAKPGDYDVIARGATSLVAKEMRAIQLDTLSQTLTPEDKDHIDERKFLAARLASRDLEGMLVSEDVAKRRQDAKAQMAQQQQEMQDQLMQSNIRKTSADAFKAVSQGQKNAAGAQGATIKAATELAQAGGTQGEQKPAG